MEKLNVQLTKEQLFDFLLYHTFSKASGFLVNMLGMGVIVVGVVMQVTGRVDFEHFLLYVIAGVAFLSYTPLLLKFRANKQIKVNPEYRDSKEYIFSEEDGILVIQNGEEKKYDWSQVQRTVTAPKTIGIYYGKDLAFIIPKEAFGDRFVPIMQMVVRHIGLNNVRLTQ